MATNKSVPGMTYPTQQGYHDGAGNPRDSAMASMKSAALSQSNANKALAGGRRRKCRGGAINAPQMQMLYQPQGGPGTNPNDQMSKILDLRHCFELCPLSFGFGISDLAHSKPDSLAFDFSLGFKINFNFQAL